MKVKIIGRVIDVKMVNRETKEGKQYTKTMVVLYSEGDVIRIFASENEKNRFSEMLNKDVEIPCYIFKRENSMVIVPITK